MTNEMGNQNTNGFLASEQENNESAKLTSQSLNASSISNDLDGLKSITGSLSYSSPNMDKPESPKLASGGYLEPTVETSQFISSGENEEKEHSKKVVTDAPLKSSVVTNDVLNEGQSIPSRENEAFEKQDANMAPADEDLDSKITSNEDNADFARIESSELDGSLIMRETSETTEEENNEAPEIINEHPKAFSTTSSVDDLKDSAHSLSYDHQASEEHKAEKSDTCECFKHVGVSNDTELTLPREFEAVYNKQTPSADNESLEKDDALIHNQTHEARVEEETKFLAQESTEEANEFRDSIVERQNQSLPANSNQENKMEDIPVEDSDSIGEIVPMNNSIQVIEDHIDQDREQKCEELEAGQSVAYLDAVDLEIEKLMMEDFADEVKEASKTESKKLLEEELKMDDIDTDSFEIQLKAVEPNEEEKDDGDDDRLEEAVFEISLQTDYTSNLMPEFLSKNIEVETAPVMESAKVSDISAADNKNEEATEYAELGDQTKEQIFRTTPIEIIRPAEYLEEFEKKCILNENETPKTDEFSIVNNKNALLAEVKSETKIQLQEKITENNEEVSTELSQEKPSETEDTETERVKCLIYTSERSDLDADESSPNYVRDQIPSMDHEKATKGEVFTSETSDTEENVREYHVSTNQESDRSPILDRKPEESEDFGNLRAPLGNLMKEEPAVKNDGSLDSKRTVEAKKSMASLDKAGEKQKRRSSLFGNCMCCTTTIN